MDPGEPHWVETSESVRERATFAIIAQAKDEPGVNLVALKRTAQCFYRGRVYDIVAASKDKTVVALYRNDEDWHVVDFNDVKMLEGDEVMNRRVAIQSAAAGVAGLMAAVCVGGYSLYKKYTAPRPRSGRPEMKAAPEKKK